MTMTFARRILAIGVLAALVLGVGAAVSLAGPPPPAPPGPPPPPPPHAQVIYDSTSPNVLGGQGFQCCGTSEFGDAVGFTSGSGRFLTQVSVELLDFAVGMNPATIPAGYTPATTWGGVSTGACAASASNSPHGTGTSCSNSVTPGGASRICVQRCGRVGMESPFRASVPGSLQIRDGLKTVWSIFTRSLSDRDASALRIRST